MNNPEYNDASSNNNITENLRFSLLVSIHQFESSSSS